VDRQPLIARLETAWRDFLQSCAGLSDSQLMTSGVTGEWVLPDTLAHVTTREEENLKHLPTLMGRQVGLIESVPEARTETPFRRRLRLDTCSHYGKHAVAIRSCRNEQLNGNKTS